ncbi:MAG: arginine--tRNA ligase [Patescibacteria group bacterium]|nr:arginine--tRNA ligase [Patescibacteria group bacterium]
MKPSIEAAVAEAVSALYDTEVSVFLTRPEEQFGDYATNVALQLAKPLGKNPREVADEIADRLQESLSDQIKTIAVAGPGFLNITLTDTALTTALSSQPEQPLSGKTVLAEYSDPNPFKPLHAGHLYTTLVGDTIARLMETAGANVTRISYGGDVGLHVGKAMWSINKFTQDEPAVLETVPVGERPTWLGERYVEGNNAYEDDETSKAEIIAVNKKVYELHNTNDHETPFAQIYWTCRTWSYEYFDQLYAELQVHPFDRTIPESEIAPLGLETVKAQQANGIYEESEGAIVFKGEDYGLHTRVFINSQGLPTYETKDVGLILTKWQDYNFDRSIVITASEQAQYMAVMLKSVEQFEPEPALRTTHLTHGMVKLQGGAKMSSRKGNIVSALDILSAAAAANLEQTGKESPETVLGAVKYAFLKNRLGGDIVYDPLESVSLEGNSGPYLQYAHARARSILRKRDSATVPIENADFTEGERTLVRKITEYSETVDKAISELLPHYICTYLYELAQTFNRFYEHNRVIDDEREVLRLALVETYADTLKNGLVVLGIHAPEEM